MNIVVHEDLKAYIDPLTPDEFEALERSLLAEGCRDALVLWGDVLVDGHNRYAICTRHGLPFQTVQNPRFQSLEDVQLWMIDQHLGRRSVSDFQRGVLALRKRQIVADRQARQRAEAIRPAADAARAAPDEAAPWDDDPSLPPAATSAASSEAAQAQPTPKLPEPAPLDSREALARAARLSSSQVVMIEKIQKQAAPELVAAVRETMAQVLVHGYTQAARLLDQADLAGDLARLDCPVQVASGNADTITPATACQAVAGAVGQDWQDLGPVGHACPLEAASAVNTLIGLR